MLMANAVSQLAAKTPGKEAAAMEAFAAALRQVQQVKPANKLPESPNTARDVAPLLLCFPSSSLSHSPAHFACHFFSMLAKNLFAC